MPEGFNGLLTHKALLVQVNGKEPLRSAEPSFFALSAIYGGSARRDNTRNIAPLLAQG